MTGHRDNHLIERKRGRFVSEADGSPHRGGHFEIVDVPAPPHVRVVRERSLRTYELTERLELTEACPHCFCAIEFVFPIATTRENFAEQLMEDNARDRQRFYDERWREYEKQERVVVGNWLESAAEFLLPSDSALARTGPPPG